LTTTVESDLQRGTAVDDAGGPIELSIVIPCLNEAPTLAACIEKAQRSLAELAVRGEVVVADNGSTDGSQKIAESMGARVVPVRESGYGRALAGGIAAARGRYVIMGDADGSYDFSALGQFVEKLREGYHLVIGNRFAGGIEPGAMPFLHKYLGNPVLSFIGRRISGSPAGDIYCGLRGFDRDMVLALDLRSPGMEFAIEMVVKATLGGLRIVEVPTVLSPDRRDRRPHLRTWRDGWRSLRFLLLYGPAWLFLYPGLALVGLGLATMAWLLPGPQTVGSVTFDVHTLLYAALGIVIGFQSIVFFLGARYFGMLEGLLPPDAKVERALRAMNLERGILIGVALVALGLAGSAYAVATWQERSFGRLDYADTLRIVIPSGTLVVLGIQTILSSFFLGILGLKRR
jgi:glycosyltransferase involved in cell wall biosynthesis